MRLDGGTGRIVFLSADGRDADATERLREAAHLAGVALALRRSRLGAVGPPSDWLVASSQDAATVRASWGPEIVAVPMGELMARLEAAPADPALAHGLLAGARENDVDGGALAPASALHGALSALVVEHRLAALTVRCFDLVTGPRTSGCLALSQLADDGVPAGCEGDVPSAIALLWLRLLTGQAAWMANPARIDPERGEIVLAHCTVPRSLVRTSTCGPTSSRASAWPSAATSLPGPVTLVRLGGRRLEQLWLAEGELVDAPREASLCRTQATVRTQPAPLTELLRAPLGNHVVLLRPGRPRRALRASRDLILR